MSEEKRMAGDYEIIQAVHIGDREIVVGENQADEQGLLYLVAYYESNAILGRYYDAIGSDDFTEIMEIYGQRIMEQAQKTRVELSAPKVQGIDNSPITAERCTPISYDDDLNGKIIVIKLEVLRPEYRRATSQVKLCTGGFGAYPHSRGSAVFCTEVYTGRQSRFEQRDVLGVLEPENQSKWVQHYLSALQQAEKQKNGKQLRRRWSGVWLPGGYGTLFLYAASEPQQGRIQSVLLSMAGPAPASCRKRYPVHYPGL